jgi:hypothetical protein
VVPWKSMPNQYADLDVPTADGAGAVFAASPLAPIKSLIVVPGEPPNGVSLIEAGVDGVNFFGVPNGRVDSQALRPYTLQLDAVVQFMRIRRYQVVAPGTTPQIGLGAPNASAPNTFATLDVPATPGLGAPLDVSQSGNVKTFCNGGRMSVGGLVVEASQDGVNFDSIGMFSAPWDPSTLTHFTVRGAYQFVRVRRLLVQTGDTPSLSCGLGEDASVGAGVGGDFSAFKQQAGTIGQTLGPDQDLVYLPGLVSGGLLTDAAIPVDEIQLTPQVFPVAGKISDLLVRQTAVGAPINPLFRLGVYRNRQDGLIYPGELLFDSGDQVGALGATELKQIPIVPPLAVAAGELLWFAYLVDADFAANVFGAASNAERAFPFLGFRPDDLVNVSNPSSYSTWKKGLPFGALPNPMPGAGPFPTLVQSGVPTPYVPVLFRFRLAT